MATARQEIMRPSNGPATPRIEWAPENPYRNANGLWVARFEGQYMPRVPVELYRMSITGPIGSQLQGFVDGRFAFATPRASLNDWSATNPIPIEPGAAIILYWNTDAAPRPFVNIYLRTR